MQSELEIAGIFARSQYLKALIVFRLLTSGVALIFMTALEMNRKKFVAHKSLKMLLHLHGFWTFLLCLSTFVESAEQAHTHFTLKYISMRNVLGIKNESSPRRLVRGTTYVSAGRTCDELQCLTGAACLGNISSKNVPHSILPECNGESISFGSFFKMIYIEIQAGLGLVLLIWFRDRIFNDPSDLLQSSNQCLIRMIPAFFGACGSVSSLLMMSAERFQASRCLSSYESSSKMRGMKFVAFHIMLTLIGVFGSAAMYHFPARVAHCTIISVDGKPIQNFVTTALFLSEFFTIYSYIKLLKRNEVRYVSQDSLNRPFTERYQLNENIRVLRLLLPIVMFVLPFGFDIRDTRNYYETNALRLLSSHTSITMAGAMGFFIFELAGFTKELYPIFEDTINMIYLQGIAMPSIFFYQYRKKRMTDLKIYAANSASGDDLVAAYDREIKRGW